jgi:2-polyprenyl-3-methyl-5-hydroxy-6-metoxy-1,4-benzoquinol methylase
MGEWDALLINYMRRYMRPDTTVLDIGAAIGLWTVPLATMARNMGADARRD